MYVSAGRRFLAFLIDIIIISTIATFVAIPFYYIFQVDRNGLSLAQSTLLNDLSNYLSSRNEDTLQAVYTSFADYVKYQAITLLFDFVSFSIVATLYLCILPLVFKYQTFGRAAAGIIVVNAGEKKLSVGRMFIRELVIFTLFYRLLGFIFLIANGIVILASHKSLVDLMSKTRMMYRYQLIDEGFDENIVDVKPTIINDDVESTKEEDNDLNESLDNEEQDKKDEETDEYMVI